MDIVKVEGSKFGRSDDKGITEQRNDRFSEVSIVKDGGFQTVRANQKKTNKRFPKPKRKQMGKISEQNSNKFVAFETIVSYD